MGACARISPVRASEMVATVRPVAASTAQLQHAVDARQMLVRPLYHAQDVLLSRLARGTWTLTALARGDARRLRHAPPDSRGWPEIRRLPPSRLERPNRSPGSWLARTPCATMRADG